MSECVLITGGSGGIGSAMALCFAKAGYRVGIHYFRNNIGAETAMSSVCALGGEARCYQADVSNAAEVEAMVGMMSEELGEITHLVNNAGHSQQKLLTDMTDRDWAYMFAVHVHGAFYCCRAVLPAMIRRKKGVILNISSIWGHSGAACEVHYSAAKAALDGMTLALAKEVGPSGVRVNGIAPGVIDTAMNQRLGQRVLAQLADAVPLGRLGLPEEVAEMALFLSGSQASYITGQVFCVDGGGLVGCQ